MPSQVGGKPEVDPALAPRSGDPTENSQDLEPVMAVLPAVADRPIAHVAGIASRRCEGEARTSVCPGPGRLVDVAAPGPAGGYCLAVLGAAVVEGVFPLYGLWWRELRPGR
jgi:hypothetical protein